MKQKLNKRDLIFLSNEKNLPIDIKEKVLHSLEKHILQFTDDDLINLDEFCADQLMFEGFDADYNPNKRGKIFEHLRDKIYFMLED